jgi:hypothetical protein
VEPIIPTRAVREDVSSLIDAVRSAVMKSDEVDSIMKAVNTALPLEWFVESREGGDDEATPTFGRVWCTSRNASPPLFTPIPYETNGVWRWCEIMRSDSERVDVRLLAAPPQAYYHVPSCETPEVCKPVCYPEFVRPDGSYSVPAPFVCPETRDPIEFARSVVGGLSLRWSVAQSVVNSAVIDVARLKGGPALSVVGPVCALPKSLVRENRSILSHFRPNPFMPLIVRMSS